MKREDSIRTSLAKASNVTREQQPPSLKVMNINNGGAEESVEGGLSKRDALDGQSQEELS